MRRAPTTCRRTVTPLPCSHQRGEVVLEGGLRQRRRWCSRPWAAVQGWERLAQSKTRAPLVRVGLRMSRPLGLVRLVLSSPSASLPAFSPASAFRIGRRPPPGTGVSEEVRMSIEGCVAHGFPELRSCRRLRLVVTKLTFDVARADLAEFGQIGVGRLLRERGHGRDPFIGLLRRPPGPPPNTHQRSQPSTRTSAHRGQASGMRLCGLFRDDKYCQAAFSSALLCETKGWSA